MNKKTFLAASIIFAFFGLMTYFSYTGFGLTSQKDPAYIRQNSVTNSRIIRGGSTHFGK